MIRSARGTLLLVTIAAGLMTAGCGSGDTIAQPPADKPTSVPAPTSDSEATPKQVEPAGDAENTRKVSWDKAKPMEGGGKLRVEWMSGVEPCTVLDKVDVAETGKKVTVTLYEGSAKGQADAICTQQLVKKITIVELEKPLDGRKVEDGAK